MNEFSASIQRHQEKLSDDVQRIVEKLAEQRGVKVPAFHWDPLWENLCAHQPVETSTGLATLLDQQGVTREAATLALCALRRVILRHAGTLGAALIDFVEERIDGALLECVQGEVRETQRAREHHDWIFHRLPAMMHSIDGQGKIAAVNDRWLEAMGYTRDEVLGRRSTEFLTPESAKYAREVVLPEYFKTGRCDNIIYQFVRKDDSLMDVMLSAVTDTNPNGVKISQAVLINVTERLEAERAAQKVSMQEEIIRSQQEMLRAISTPLVPLGDGILLMPLVGHIDASRAERIMAVLLEGVVTHVAEVAILDVTGVITMDAEVAEGIIGATKAVGLLGAHVVLTGIGPSAARTLVELGVDLGSITTKSTLRDGLTSARKRITRERSAPRARM